MKVFYCTKCVYPSSSAVALAFDENGICSGCRTSQEKKGIDWSERKKKFEKLIEEYRSKNGTGYDLIIPVSGQSIFSGHFILKFLLNFFSLGALEIIIIPVLIFPII